MLGNREEEEDITLLDRFHSLIIITLFRLLEIKYLISSLHVIIIRRPIFPSILQIHFFTNFCFFESSETCFDL